MVILESRIGSGAANNRRINPGRFIKKILLAIKDLQLDEILPGGTVYFFRLPAGDPSSFSKPISVMMAGLRPAAARIKWEMTPWGRLYASIFSSAANCTKKGDRLQCPPTTSLEKTFIGEAIQQKTFAATALTGDIPESQVPAAHLFREIAFPGRPLYYRGDKESQSH